jgi:hypothetical protein
VSQTLGHTSATIAQSPEGVLGEQNCPAGQSQEVVQEIPLPSLMHNPPPEASWLQKQPPRVPPGQDSGSFGSQGIAFGGIQDSTHMPPLHFPSQQSLPVVQVAPSDPQAAAQVPPSQLPLQHCSSFLHAFPLRLQPGGSAAASPMPSDPSAPPTRAAPINLRALPREMLPLASPLASSSKECSLACGGIGFSHPFPKGARLGKAPPR